MVLQYHLLEDLVFFLLFESMSVFFYFVKFFMKALHWRFLDPFQLQVSFDLGLLELVLDCFDLFVYVKIYVLLGAYCFVVGGIFLILFLIFIVHILITWLI